ncbi:hypothetical protein SAMN05192573_102464 [Mucilaginibacter gossypii]|uniref:Uncharacterized protein n=1 Tax=Mucilaginibacter gossypii TaxID=551996 RepID=A0A1G7S658_9SPHI|nr:hypothetical protein SAMN05192573_102464 [Mucilaginibacter gossypii]
MCFFYYNELLCISTKVKVLLEKTSHLMYEVGVFLTKINEWYWNLLQVYPSRTWKFLKQDWACHYKQFDVPIWNIKLFNLLTITDW